MSGTVADSNRTEIVNTFGRVAVSIVGIIAFMVVAILVLTAKGTPSEAGLVVLGIVGGGYTAVMGYWIGSSAGSTSKDAKISTMTPAPAPGGTTTVTAPPAAPPGSTTVTATPATTTTTTPTGTSTVVEPIAPIIIPPNTGVQT